MNDGPVSQSNVMVETTDSLEAVGVFRGWKNIFFMVVLVCLLVTQAAFWLVDLGVVEVAETPQATVDTPQADPIEAAAESVTAPESAPTTEATPTPESVTVTESAPVADANDAEPAGGFLDNLTFEMLSRVVGIVNGIVIVAAVLYALTMFFCLMVSLVGRLGGINHVTRGFVLSLIMAVLIIPWHRLFGPNVVGVIYSPLELIQWMAAKGESTTNTVIYYLRFSGYWFVVLLLLILSQVRSARWSKAILRRLEII